MSEIEKNLFYISKENASVQRALNEHARFVRSSTDQRLQSIVVGRLFFVIQHVDLESPLGEYISYLYYYAKVSSISDDYAWATLLALISQLWSRKDIYQLRGSDFESLRYCRYFVYRIAKKSGIKYKIPSDVSALKRYLELSEKKSSSNGNSKKSKHPASRNIPGSRAGKLVVNAAVLDSFSLTDLLYLINDRKSHSREENRVKKTKSSSIFLQWIHPIIVLVLKIDSTFGKAVGDTLAINPNSKVNRFVECDYLDKSVLEASVNVSNAFNNAAAKLGLHDYER